MKINKLFIGLLILLALTFLVLAAEEPPVLDNHQFYGQVQWDKNVTIAPAVVIAKVGETSYVSSVETGGTCDALVCKSKYGYTEIIRVQATAGAQIEIFLDNELIESIAYEANKAQKYDINIAAVPFSCDPDWDCDAWTNCTNGTKSHFCVDKNKCDPAELNKTITNKCGTVVNVTTNVTSTPIVCFYVWDCSSWSACINNQKSRTCTRTDSCDTKLAAGDVDSIVKTPKLSEKDVCISTTTPTPSAAEPEVPAFPEQTIPEPAEEKSNLLYYIIGFVVFILIVGGVLVYFFVIKKGGSAIEDNVKSQLSSVFNRGKQGGLSEGQVKEKLVGKGWDEGIVKKFLRQR